MRFHLLTVVWGAEFTDRFAGVTLRSLLAPGNLPDLAAAHPVVYDIHATAADLERLAAHPVFRRAAQLVEFRLHVFPIAQIDPRNPSSHWILWHRGAARLRDADDVLVTVAADHLFSRGTLLRWAELFLRGNLAMFGSGVQVVAETIEEEVARTFPPAQPVDLPVEALHDLMFRHLHPVKISMLRGSPRWIAHPEEHLRPLPGYGIAQNVLTSHAVAFRPRAVRMNDNFCPVEKLDRIAFEPCRYLSLEPALKNLSLYLHPWQMDERTLSHFGEWADHFFFAANLLESRTTHVYPIAEPIATAQRRRAELSARFFVGQMHASRQIVRLWRCLHDRGQCLAARWLATAHVHARLRRRLPLRVPAAVFIPAEGVLARIAASERSYLLAQGGRRLIAAVRAHVAEGHHGLARGDWLAPSAAGAIRAGDGSHYTAAARGTVRIVAGPIRVDEIEIYIIDRPLTSLTLRPATTAEATEVAVRSLVDRAQRRTARAKAALLRQLQRNHRLYRLVLAARIALGDRLRRSDGAPRAGTVPELEPALTLYRRGLAWRALDAMGQLYAFYRTIVLAGADVTVVPAARLAQAAEAGDRAGRLLAGAAQQVPHFAEAWLELGFARLAAGEPDAASEAFARASTLPPLLERTRSDPDPRMVAAIERARLLAGENRTAEALAVLEAAPSASPVPWTFHQLRAGLLLEAGRTDEALESFERSLRQDHIHPSFAALLPRNLATLEAILAAEPEGYPARERKVPDLNSLCQ
jgi:tetratricopeptide (TPR) repeat protein